MINPPCMCGHSIEEHQGDKSPGCEECECIHFDADPSFMECEPETKTQ
jgi:hypothetical protein